MKTLRVITILLIIVTFILLAAIAVLWFTQKPEENGNIAAVKTDETVLEASTRIMRLIKERDYADLAKTVHTEKGVTFSPYYFIEPATSVTLTPEKLEGAALDKTVYDWGLSPARGDAIKLTIPEYFDQYVFPHDFTQPEMVSINRIIGPGGTAEMIKNVYPDSEFVEFHFPGFDPKYEGMDWSSTRLVLQKEAGEWKLVGVIAGYWTP